jgi:hypothetical protein
MTPDYELGIREGYRRVAETLRKMTRTMTIQWLQNELKDAPRPSTGRPGDCPPDLIEVRRNDDGSLDEIVAENCFVHLEQMDERHFWLGVSKEGYRQSVNLYVADNGMILATSEMNDIRDAP